MKVAVVGAGAIGGYFGAQAERAGHGVVLCTRSPFEALTIESAGGSHRFEATVLTDPRDATVHAPADWILLATKAHQTAAASVWLRALIGPDTRAVVVLQNGVEHAERVRDYVGTTPILPSTVLCAAEAVAPGRIVHHGYAKLEVPSGPLARALSDLLNGSDAEIELCPDFTTAVWRKLLANVCANPITALTGRRLPVVAHPELRSLALGLTRECIAVARAEGAQIEFGEAETHVTRYAHVPPEMGSSMLYDREAGRPLEIDALNGAVVRLGARHGIPTPVNEMVAGLLKVLTEPAD